MTVAKSIAAGLPLSGVIGKAEIMDAPVDGGVGGTYVGNPVAQAAALAVLDVFEDEGLVERGRRVGDVIRGRMLAWQERFPAIGDVRGLGPMLAIELVEDRSTKTPSPGLATRITAEAAQRGLLLLKAGIHGNCIRVLCPLVIAEQEVEEALGVWQEALEAVLA
jgi:4-aminobutyrate aminotransferase/(S)-3-amino-2-methylpropionate transaminase